MNTKDLFLNFPDEAACKRLLKNLREQEGVICKKCGAEEHYWKNDKACFECKSCKHRTSLRSGTIMEHSKLPVKYWFLSYYLYEIARKEIPALELQKVFCHKRYEPIWLMRKKIKESGKKQNILNQLSKHLPKGEIMP